MNRWTNDEHYPTALLPAVGLRVVAKGEGFMSRPCSTRPSAGVPQNAAPGLLQLLRKLDLNHETPPISMPLWPRCSSLHAKKR